MSKRVLMTGHNGYLGSAMAQRFGDAGHRVAGLDTFFFRQCTFTDDFANPPAVEKDIREVTLRDLEGFDAVVHLAALSNDPVGDLNDRWTEEINTEAAVRLAEAAREAGVRRFLFSSSCIMYGAAMEAEVDEDSPLDPKTAYARSKVAAERRIARLATDRFSPVFLRNGTVYGLSPRMRFDTVINSLVGSAIATGKVTVYSDGTPWRPVVHIEDVASIFLAALEAPPERVHNQAINAGWPDSNHCVAEMAQIVARTVPGCQVECLARPGADQRTYKTRFAKMSRLLPGVRMRWTLEDGVRTLHRQLCSRLTEREFRDKRFTRLKWLRHLIDTGQLDDSLRWEEALVFAEAHP